MAGNRTRSGACPAWRWNDGNILPDRLEPGSGSVWLRPQSLPGRSRICSRVQPLEARAIQVLQQCRQREQLLGFGTDLGRTWAAAAPDLGDDLQPLRRAQGFEGP